MLNNLMNSPPVNLFILRVLPSGPTGLYSLKENMKMMGEWKEILNYIMSKADLGQEEHKASNRENGRLTS